MSADGIRFDSSDLREREEAFQTGYVGVPGAELYCEVTGEGHPLVLLHAGIGDLTMWDEQVSALARRYRVVRYDQRGFGRSRITSDTPYSRHDDLEAILTMLEIERAHLLGSSLGAQTAIDFTLAYPSMVTALVTVAPGVGGFEEEATLTTERLSEVEHAEAAGDLERAADLSVRLWLDGPLRQPREVPEALRERVRAMIRRTLEMPSVPSPVRLDPPAITQLDEVVAPTLVVVGDRDVPEALRQSELVAMRVPQARKVVVPNAAHLPNLEQADQFNRIVLDFLEIVDGQ